MNGVTLSAQNLVKRYGGVVALSDGNLEVHSGEVVTLVGANGSGKSNVADAVLWVLGLTVRLLFRRDPAIWALEKQPGDTKGACP